jgi:GT2 family glycosyltransferase
MIAFQFLNPDGSLQHSTYSFPTVPRMLLALSGLREWVPFAKWTYTLARFIHRSEGRSRFWAHDRTVPVETFMGAAMLARALAVREVGLMDEVSMLGGEETEWHRRFWNSGWKIMFLADAPILHYGSQTLRVMPGLEVEYLKGTLNYFAKHRSRLLVATFCVLALPVVGIRALGCKLLGKREQLAARRACLRVLVRELSGAPLERAVGSFRSD